MHVHVCVTAVLDQALANNGPGDKYGPPPVFVQKVFWDTDTSIYLYIV